MTLLKLPRLLNKGTASNKTRLQLIRNQIDFFWSSRARRSFQIYNYYKQIWDETALRQFLRHFRNNIVSSNYFEDKRLLDRRMTNILKVAIFNESE
jgi:hypothetical protein